MDNYDYRASTVIFSEVSCSKAICCKVVGLLFGFEFTELETEVALQIELFSLLPCPFRARVPMVVAVARTVAMITKR